MNGYDLNRNAYKIGRTGSEGVRKRVRVRTRIRVRAGSVRVRRDGEIEPTRIWGGGSGGGVDGLAEEA